MFEFCKMRILLRSKKSFRGLAVLPAMAGLVLMGAGSAAANTITFAQYSDVSAGQDWSITTSGAGCNTPATPCSTTIKVNSAGFNSLFIFVPGSGLGTVPVAADFSFTATSTNTIGNCSSTCATSPNPDSYTQGGYNGTFTYIGLGPYAGLTLLTGTFSNAIFGATLNGGTGNVAYSGSVTINPANLTFSSQVLDFSAQTAENASWTFSSVNPLFSIGNANGSFQAYPSVGTFLATGAGTFATAPGFLPEPDSLTLTSVGLGLCLVGFGLRGFRARVKPTSR